MADLHPGDGDQLKKYWVAGAGRKRWATATELFNHIRRYVRPDERAWRVTATWFHLATGRWPGESKGKNPLGVG